MDYSKNLLNVFNFLASSEIRLEGEDIHSCIGIGLRLSYIFQTCCSMLIHLLTYFCAVQGYLSVLSFLVIQHAWLTVLHGTSP
uniref:Uncharacterized protein n=1 Tax=Arundo donax TaxID=35708 RepID=A0A0A8Z5U3_ARUDO